LQSQRSFEQAWRIIPLTRSEQQRHIERSEQILAETAPGVTPVLYWSQAEPAGVVLGFSQKATILNAQAVTELRMPVYHRRAGGTAVLVGPHLLALDIVLPAEHRLVLTDLVESYRWLGETWVRALHLLGIETRVVSPTEAHTQRALAKQETLRARESVLRRACYASNSSYEVVVGARKVVGLDMIRRRHGSLLQAGILLSWESETLAHLLGHTREEQKLLRQELPKRAIGLDELMQRTVTAQEVMQAFEVVLDSV
ncbi:MAG: lipoyl protein ligase domain-containing protein, partial [Ktedonobacteraceae bacterium]